MRTEDLVRLGIGETVSGASWGRSVESPGGGTLDSLSPIDGELIASVRMASVDDYEAIMLGAQEAWGLWRQFPAPKRGEIVRRIGDELRRHKEPLGRLVTLETGKILSEGLGEVQEMIDVCDLAVGLSRQLYGRSMHSERPAHRMYEQWHPLGPVGVITSFNFPAAVWSWNAAIALACGDVVVWKPSSLAPLTAVAVQGIVGRVLAESGWEGVSNLVVGRGAEVGEHLIADPRVPLVSATGSTRMGRHVGTVVARRLGRTILELGGNNAVVVERDADLDLASRAIRFGALGTAGQRCTSTRRVLVHASVADDLVRRLASSWSGITIGDPLDPASVMGPLVSREAVAGMQKALEDAREQGGDVILGGEPIEDDTHRGGCWVRPAIVEARRDMPIIREETFAPVLWIVRFDTLEQAIEMHNDVPQGLGSAIFTDSLRTAETFLGHGGSDCGIVNVNGSTSGAEIGGAFGGEKETGGGREAGSDAWKAYMRRQTVTVNWSGDLPLAQGVTFGDGG